MWGRGAVMSNAITTEALLESPKVFGISTMTNAQRAWCRALDGLPLGDLVNDPEVLRIFGGAVRC